MKLATSSTYCDSLWATPPSNIQTMRLAFRHGHDSYHLRRRFDWDGPLPHKRTASPFQKNALKCSQAVAFSLLDNFRRLHGFSWPGVQEHESLAAEQGVAEMVAAFVSAIRTGSPSPIPIDELIEVSRTTLKAASF